MNELGPDARSILDAARSRERPSDADRARVRRNMMRALAAGGAAAAATTVGTGAAAKGTGAAAATIAASSTASVAGKMVATLVLVGAVGAGLGSVGSHSVGPHSVGPQSAHTHNNAPADSRPPAAFAPPDMSTPPPAEPTESEPSPGLEPQTEPSDPPRAAAPAVSRAQPRSSATSVPAMPEAAEDPLDVETRGLGEAHRALQSGDARRALTLLDQQAAAHAQGELREERAAARVVALCKLGRTKEALAVAESFLRENPGSLLADRVRAACPSPPSP